MTGLPEHSSTMTTKTLRQKSPFVVKVVYPRQVRDDWSGATTSERESLVVFMKTHCRQFCSLPNHLFLHEFSDEFIILYVAVGVLVSGEDSGNLVINKFLSHAS